MAPEIELQIVRGKTFRFAYLYADDELVYRPILAMPVKAPVRLTVPAHGIPDGWPVQVVCVKAPAQLNSDPDSEEPYYFVRRVDDDIIELNTVNAHCWKPYSGSGLVVFNRPLDLAGWQCRAQVRDRVGGQVLFAWHSDPLQDPDGLAIVDVDAGAFVLTIDADVAAALTWRRGVYDLEAIAPSGDVYPVTAVSQVTVEDEVTA